MEEAEGPAGIVASIGMHVFQVGGRGLAGERDMQPVREGLSAAE